MTKRYALKDDQWSTIENLLPGRKETVGVTANNNRLFVEAVLYRYRAGIPWRERRIVRRIFYPLGLAIFEQYIQGILDGVKKVFGR